MSAVRRVLNFGEDVPVLRQNQGLFGSEFFAPMGPSASSAQLEAIFSQHVGRNNGPVLVENNGLVHVENHGPVHAENVGPEPVERLEPNQLPACRDLFPELRTAESKRELKQWLANSIAEASNKCLRDAEQKYNFNFREFKPVEAENQSYIWWRVPESDPNMPQFYKNVQNRSMKKTEMCKLRDVQNVPRASENHEHTVTERASSSPLNEASSPSSNETSSSLSLSEASPSLTVFNVSPMKRNDVTRRKRQARSLVLTDGDLSPQPRITNYMRSLSRTPKKLTPKKLTSKKLTPKKL